MQMYGMTEMTGSVVTHVNGSDVYSVGRVLLGTEMKVEVVEKQ